MQLIIDATTVEELMEKVCALANKFGVDLSESTQTPITVEVVEAAKTVEVEVEEAPKKKKAKVEKKEELSPITAAEIITGKTIADPTFTKKDIADACQKVSEAKGLEIAREILGKFEAKRISEVKEEDYSKFVEACEGCLK